ncbi:MAG: MFS transporter [Acidobacteriota bacterium]
MNKRALTVIFLVVFIDLVGFGIVIPLLPLYGEQYHPGPAQFGTLMMIYSLMQFLFSPILGRLSDRYGRRPVLLISLTGNVAGYLTFAFQQSLEALFLARIVAGICGGNISTAHAVIADTTGPQDRAKGMGLVGAAFGLGFIFGPAIGGIALEISESAPGLFAAGLSAAAFVFALIALPETWSAEKRLGGASRRYGTFSLEGLLRAVSHPQIGVLLLIFFLTTFAFANFEGTFALYLEHRMGLGPKQVAYLFAYVGILGAVIQGGLIGRVVKAFGERRLVVTGLALLACGFAGLILIDTTPPMLALLGVLALGTGLANPSLSSLVSKHATIDEQGGVFGIYQSVASFARILGPFWGVYSFQRFGTNFPYVTAGAVSLACCALALVSFRGLRDRTRLQ